MYECTEKTNREEQGGVYVGVWEQPTPPHIPVLLSQLTCFQWIHVYIMSLVFHTRIEQQHVIQVTMFNQFEENSKTQFRSWLSELGIEYIEKNIAEDPAILNELQVLRVFYTRATFDGGDSVVGCDCKKLEEQLILLNVEEPSLLDFIE